MMNSNLNHSNQCHASILNLPASCIHRICFFLQVQSDDAIPSTNTSTNTQPSLPPSPHQHLLLPLLKTCHKLNSIISPGPYFAKKVVFDDGFDEGRLFGFLMNSVERYGGVLEELWVGFEGWDVVEDYDEDEDEEDDDDGSDDRNDTNENDYNNNNENDHHHDDSSQPFPPRPSLNHNPSSSSSPSSFDSQLLSFVSRCSTLSEILRHTKNLRQLSISFNLPNYLNNSLTSNTSSTTTRTATRTTTMITRTGTIAHHYPRRNFQSLNATRARGGGGGRSRRRGWGGGPLDSGGIYNAVANVIEALATTNFTGGRNSTTTDDDGDSDGDGDGDDSSEPDEKRLGGLGLESLRLDFGFGLGLMSRGALSLSLSSWISLIISKNRHSLKELFLIGTSSIASNGRNIGNVIGGANNVSCSLEKVELVGTFFEASERGRILFDRLKILRILDFRGSLSTPTLMNLLTGVNKSLEFFELSRGSMEDLTNDEDLPFLGTIQFPKLIKLKIQKIWLESDSNRNNNKDNKVEYLSQWVNSFKQVLKIFKLSPKLKSICLDTFPSEHLTLVIARMIGASRTITPTTTATTTKTKKPSTSPGGDMKRKNRQNHYPNQEWWPALKEFRYWVHRDSPRHQLVNRKGKVDDFDREMMQALWVKRPMTLVSKGHGKMFDDGGVNTSYFLPGLATEKEKETGFKGRDGKEDAVAIRDRSDRVLSHFRFNPSGTTESKSVPIPGDIVIWILDHILDEVDHSHSNKIETPFDHDPYYLPTGRRRVSTKIYIQPVPTPSPSEIETLWIGDFKRSDALSLVSACKEFWLAGRSKLYSRLRVHNMPTHHLVSFASKSLPAWKPHIRHVTLQLTGVDLFRTRNSFGFVPNPEDSTLYDLALRGRIFSELLRELVALRSLKLTVGFLQESVYPNLKQPMMETLLEALAKLLKSCASASKTWRLTDFEMGLSLSSGSTSPVAPWRHRHNTAGEASGRNPTAEASFERKLYAVRSCISEICANNSSTLHHLTISPIAISSTLISPTQTNPTPWRVMPSNFPPSLSISHAPLFNRPISLTAGIRKLELSRCHNMDINFLLPCRMSLGELELHDCTGIGHSNPPTYQAAIRVQGAPAPWRLPPLPLLPPVAPNTSQNAGGDRENDGDGHDPSDNWDNLFPNLRILRFVHSDFNSMKWLVDFLRSCRSSLRILEFDDCLTDQNHFAHAAPPVTAEDAVPLNNLQDLAMDAKDPVLFEGICQITSFSALKNFCLIGEMTNDSVLESLKQINNKALWPSLEEIVISNEPVSFGDIDRPSPAVMARMTLRESWRSATFSNGKEHGLGSYRIFRLDGFGPPPKDTSQEKRPRATSLTPATASLSDWAIPKLKIPATARPRAMSLS